MITCLITIKEGPKGYYIDMLPNQDGATPKELNAASCFDVAFKLVGEYLARKGARGEAIESRDLELIRGIVEKKIKDFDSDP